jgi:hypothetical protein
VNNDVLSRRVLVVYALWDMWLSLALSASEIHKRDSIFLNENAHCAHVVNIIDCQPLGTLLIFLIPSGRQPSKDANGRCILSFAN